MKHNSKDCGPPIVNNMANREVDASTSVSYLRLRMFIANCSCLMLIYMCKGRDPLQEQPNIKRRKTDKVFFEKRSLNIQQPEHPKMKRKSMEKEIY